VDGDGGDTLWSFHLVGVSAPDGRTLRIEAFPDEAWDTALARFTELTADLRTPSAENEATRRTRHDLDLLLAGRYDELEATLRPDFERIDRRHGIAGAPITSAVDYLASLRAIMEQFDALTSEPIAVRGERLHLSRVIWGRPDDFHVTALVVFEFDETGLGVANVTFDEDDLPAAVDVLEARHAELAGVDYPAVERNASQGLAAWRRGDFDAFAAAHAPDFTFDDRSPLGAGVLDLDTYLESLRTFAEMVPDTMPFFSRIFTCGNVGLSTLTSKVRDRDGREFEWHLAYLGRVDQRGLATHRVAFDIEQWDEALALFDEWCAAEDS
jgi:hypothetical protein